MNVIINTNLGPISIMNSLPVVTAESHTDERDREDTCCGSFNIHCKIAIFSSPNPPSTSTWKHSSVFNDLMVELTYFHRWKNLNIKNELNKFLANWFRSEPSTSINILKRRLFSLVFIRSNEFKWYRYSDHSFYGMKTEEKILILRILNNEIGF